MFKLQIKPGIFLGIIVMFMISSQIFASSMISEISSSFSKYYKNGIDESYMQAPYSSEFSKDPFMDNLNTSIDKEFQKKVAGVQYLSTTLQNKGVGSLSNEKIWGILFYFSSGFRADIIDSIKQEADEYPLTGFNLSKEEVKTYCELYFNDINKDVLGNNSKNNDITASTPDTILSNCKEFFLEEYEKGIQDISNLQITQEAELGADKYWNNTVEDSPFDIMNDLNVVGELFYKEVEAPIQPVFFHLPQFKYSESHLEQDKQNSEAESAAIGHSTQTQNIGNPTRKSSKSQAKGNGASSDSGQPTVVMDPEISKFMNGGGEGENSSNLTKNTMFYGTSCDDDGGELDGGDEPSVSIESLLDKDFREYTDDEYEAVVDFMRDSIDKGQDYLEPEVVEEITNFRESLGIENDTFKADSESQLDKLRENLKKCYAKCEAIPKVRIDQIASCYIMCSCGEYSSEAFNPEEYPGLGPILTVRFCAVPGVNYDFSVGGKKIFSFEEGINEIYGALDALEREGRLGIRVPQHNFLDSSTKKMNFSKALTITLKQENVDIFGKRTKDKSRSDEVVESELKKENQEDLELLNISNPLENPESKNRFRIIGYEGEYVKGYEASSNADVIREGENNANGDYAGGNTSDRLKRYKQLGDNLSLWRENQISLRTNIEFYVGQWEAAAEFLYNKRTPQK